MDPIQKLKEKLIALAAEARDIEAKADEGSRSLSEDELKKLDVIQASFKSIEAEVQRREATAAMEAKLALPQRATMPADVVAANVAPERARITGGDVPGASAGTFGFRSMGEWAKAALTGAKKGDLDPRIKNAPSSFGQEGVNPDGGYMVPPDFKTNVVKQILGEDSLLGRTDQQVTSSNRIVLPLDSTSPWDTTNGPQVSTAGEGGTISASKPSLGQLELPLHKYVALVPMTDELLEDAPALTSWLNRKVPEKFAFRLNNDLIAGTGVGQLQGLLNAASKVTAAAESGQGAGTVVAKNILKMWNRLYGPWRTNAVWLINQDVEQQLQQLVLSSSPTIPSYMPPGGFSASPYATLLGRPIIVTEACSALGTEGDIILTDLMQYLSAVKSGGMRTDVSIHLYFDSDMTAFRFVMRVGGQSVLPAAIARKNGSNTLSNIVTLNSTRT